MTSQRLDALTVNALYPDYFIQVGQVAHELAKCIQHSDGKKYASLAPLRSYYGRLDSWWNEWARAIEKDPHQQRRDHEYLDQNVRIVQAWLDTPVDEPLKLEVWGRWKPSAERTLALWASSVGTWVSIDSMRKDRIGPYSRYRSVAVFCNGAPTFMEAAVEETTRWRTYLGVPIWFDTLDGSIPVGVITLASMKSHPATSVKLDARRLGFVIDMMKDIGSNILNPSGRSAPRPLPVDSTA
jgi:hypothetical protein